MSAATCALSPNQDSSRSVLGSRSQRAAGSPTVSGSRSGTVAFRQYTDVPVLCGSQHQAGALIAAVAYGVRWRLGN